MSNPVETVRRPPSDQLGEMTQSDLTGNSERSSEMAVRQVKTRPGQYLEKIAREVTDV
jgi:hypothetical protein